MKKIIRTNNLQKAFESYDAAKGTPVVHVDELPTRDIRDVVYGVTTYDTTGGQSTVYYMGNSVKQSLECIGFPVGMVLELEDGVDPNEMFTPVVYSHTITLHYYDENGEPTTSEIEFNGATNRTAISLPIAASVDRFTFKGTWIGANGMSYTTGIPANSIDSDIDLYACFSQKKPVEGVDFTLGYDLLGSYDGEEMELVRITSGLSMIGAVALKNSNFLNIDEYYTNVNSTQYAQLYFPEVTVDGLTVVDQSEIVNVPIKFAKAKPVKDTDYTVSGSTVTITSDKVIEKKLSDDTWTVVTGTVAVGTEIRFAETYMYNASSGVVTE